MQTQRSGMLRQMSVVNRTQSIFTKTKSKNKTPVSRHGQCADNEWWCFVLIPNYTQPSHQESSSQLERDLFNWRGLELCRRSA